jgi:hypothetical protein
MGSELVFQEVKLTQRGVEDVVARQVLFREDRRPLEVLLDRIAQVAPRPHDDVFLQVELILEIHGHIRIE